jgi:ribosomal protein S1
MINTEETPITTFIPFQQGTYNFDEVKILTSENKEYSDALDNYFLKHNIPNQIKVGTKINGTLIAKNNKYASINFMGKAPINVDNSGNERIHIDKLEIGDEVSVMITDISDKKEFIYSGSLSLLQDQEMHEFLYDSFLTKKVLTVHVKEMNHAGYNVILNVDDNETTLFMPHLVTDVNKLFNPESILNTDIEIMIEYFSKDNKKSFIASRKKYLQTLIPQAIKELKRGGKYVGTITGSTDFAVFVQFNQCLTGMIHKTNLTEEAQGMLGTIKPGIHIEFYVKDILKDRLFLTQELKETLWDTIAAKQYYTGKAVAIKEYGIMVSLDYETKGLLHKSMLNKSLTEYVLGETLHVQVSKVDKNLRQITLCLQK